MRETVLVVGMNHRTAPLAQRERLAVSPCDLSTVLAEAQRLEAVEEVVMLSTCHRVELYAASPDPTRSATAIYRFLSARSGLSPEALRAGLYQATGVRAVRHLIRVAAGLDSMVVGESEVLAQVKQGYLASHAVGATGPVLNRLFQHALHAAKTIRAGTGIGRHKASIGAVVVALARGLFGDRLPSCEVLLWGAGQVAEATVHHLMKAGIAQLWIVSRTAARAQSLAAQCRGMWLSWEEAVQHLARVEIAIVCTQAPHYVIDAADLDAVASPRGARPLVLIDLSVPRNVDPDVRHHPQVRLYDVDALRGMAEQGMAARRREAQHGEAMAQAEASQFMQWWWKHPVPHPEGLPWRMVPVAVSA